MPKVEKVLENHGLLEEVPWISVEFRSHKRGDPFVCSGNSADRLRPPKQLRVLCGSSLSCESQQSPPGLALPMCGNTATHWLPTTEGKAEGVAYLLLSRRVTSQLHQTRLHRLSEPGAEEPFVSKESLECLPKGGKNKQTNETNKQNTFEEML